MSTGELACTYAAALLYDDGIPITAEKIATIVESANLKIDSYWPGLFSKLFEKRSIEDLILNAVSGGVPAAVAAPVSGGSGDSAAPAAPAAEEKKDEPLDESDDDLGFSLFD
ncbi:large ribosomal subunit protein P1 [Ziziphus jujuba]|uniref:60S acidic ribosomal protein P1-like n=1 Tax=Ziziphus jujuba TaxID=326968 RepID=A0A6P3ZZZ8_ZIZJJ|nr:large ribosomal subunit protein P1 [Ziziphus jujuba]XP_024931299.1 large ribosomal subunit protein P1 [Ziziphus jujuba]